MPRKEEEKQELQQSEVDRKVYKGRQMITAKYKASLLENKLTSIALSRLTMEGDTPVATLFPSEIKKLLGRQSDTNIYKKLISTAKTMTGHQMVIEDNNGNFEVLAMITNARYMLMTTALSQRFSQKTPIWQRVLVAFYASDEIFGATIARPGYIMPTYSYGLSTVAIPLWSLGTALGVVAGNVLPMRVISALGVALYGMFLAIIVPPSKKDTAVLLAVIASFISSYLCGILPVISTWNSSTITILLTIVISSIAAIVRPRADVEEEEEEA